MPQLQVQIDESSCTYCSVNDVCFPKHLKIAQLKEFENSIDQSGILKKGDYLHEQGDTIKSLFIIRSGSVKQYVSRHRNEEQILNFFLPGELVGLDSLNMQHYGYSVIALENTSYCALPLSRLKPLYKKIPILQETMLKAMSKVISFEKEMLLTACNKTANARFATFLLSLSKRYSTLGYANNEIYLPMSRQEIGIYLGLTSETVSRIITRFQNDNLISVDHKQIKIMDMSRLEKICQACTNCKITEHHLS